MKNLLFKLNKTKIVGRSKKTILNSKMAIFVEKNKKY